MCVSQSGLSRRSVQLSLSTPPGCSPVQGSYSKRLKGRGGSPCGYSVAGAGTDLHDLKGIHWAVYTHVKGTVGVIIAVLVVSRAHTHACVLPAVSFEEKIVIILFVYRTRSSPRLFHNIVVTRAYTVHAAHRSISRGLRTSPSHVAAAAALDTTRHNPYDPYSRDIGPSAPSPGSPSSPGSTVPSTQSLKKGTWLG